MGLPHTPIGLPEVGILVVDDEQAVREAFSLVLDFFLPPPSGNTGAGSSLEAMQDKLFAQGNKTGKRDFTARVVYCAQGEEAIAKVKEGLPRGESFAMVFLDVRMPPGLDGAATAAAIRLLDPQINLVIMTGFSDFSMAEAAEETPPPDKLLFFRKPFHLDEVRQLVHALGSKWLMEREMATYRLGLESLVEERTESLLREIGERKSAEAASRKAYMSRIAISALLESGLEPLTLDAQLQAGLEIILTVPWLNIERKGSIHLLDPESGQLRMAAQAGLGETQRQACRQIAIGHCICGRAARSREILFERSDSHAHEVILPGDPLHGHYGVPILFQNELLGVLNLYLPPHHARAADEEAFLVIMANMLANLIRRKQVEERLHHLVFHDQLTGLPNRQLFDDRLEQQIREARRQNTPLAVMYLDLDRFKEVNDSLGHRAGDRLLAQVGERIRAALRESDTVARMGGDEFTIILPQVHDREDAGFVAGKILERLCTPFGCDENHCQIGASIGISLFPEDGASAQELLIAADRALYAVKEGGRSHFRHYEKSMTLGREST